MLMYAAVCAGNRNHNSETVGDVVELIAGNHESGTDSALFMSNLR